MVVLLCHLIQFQRNIVLHYSYHQIQQQTSFYFNLKAKTELLTHVMITRTECVKQFNLTEQITRFQLNINCCLFSTHNFNTIRTLTSHNLHTSASRLMSHEIIILPFCPSKRKIGLC
jgi:hypothetical protein